MHGSGILAADAPFVKAVCAEYTVVTKGEQRDCNICSYWSYRGGDCQSVSRCAAGSPQESGNAHVSGLRPAPIGDSVAGGNCLFDRQAPVSVLWKPECGTQSYPLRG